MFNIINMALYVIHMLYYVILQYIKVLFAWAEGGVLIRSIFITVMNKVSPVYGKSCY